MTIDDKRRGGRSAARDLERYASLFADRTSVMKSSAMRDLMAVIARPEVISLAGGLPDTSTFAPEEFAKIMSVVAAKDSARALQYSPTEGLPEITEPICWIMEAEGTPVDPDDVLITTGGQQVIDLACKTFLDPGDIVIAEAPTYPGAVPTFSAYQANVIQIDIDADGMRVDLLEETLERLEREGKRPKFIYTIPTFQNPGGVTMSLPRRKRLVEVARERELLVLEDNPYGLLRYEGDPLPSLYALDGGEFVIYCGTFSKTLAPGTRLGWAAGPRPVIAKFNVGKQASDLCSSSMTQLFVVEYLRSGRWPAYIERLKELYAHRRDVMLDALAEHFPEGATWTRPEGGMFVWATLPDGIDTTDLLAKALTRNVAFVPGRAAYLDGRGATSMRLSFATMADDQLREGIRRIAEVADSQLDLLGSLTGRPRGGGGAAAQPPKPAQRAENVVDLPPRRRDAADRRSS
jgi:2-aminoadipate transaminase